MGTKEYRKGTQAKAKTGHPRQAQHLTECLNLVTAMATKKNKPTARLGPECDGQANLG